MVTNMFSKNTTVMLNSSKDHNYTAAHFEFNISDHRPSTVGVFHKNIL